MVSDVGRLRKKPRTKADDLSLQVLRNVRKEGTRQASRCRAVKERNEMNNQQETTKRECRCRGEGCRCLQAMKSCQMKGERQTVGKKWERCRRNRFKA
jgi:hypothetical protein